MTGWYILVFMEAFELKSMYDALYPRLDERARRRFAGAAVKACGRTCISFVAKTLGLARNTVIAGYNELDSCNSVDDARVRAKGGGRKKLTENNDNLIFELEKLVEPLTRGDPMSPLRWTCKSTQKLAVELSKRGYPVSPRTVSALLKSLKYSLQANRKTREGGNHPDRNAQFLFINERVQAFQAEGQPAISVDAKKKELVGEFKNGGREWRPRGTPDNVNVYVFQSLSGGKVTPFGVFDPQRNEGWVSVGIDHDTASFAVESIRRWWLEMGKSVYPNAARLLIMADGGGSNGSRNRLWKIELQKLSNEMGIEIHICHFPPGTSKWNKIEHRMFSYISKNWRGRPLQDLATIVNLIGATTTTKGLKINCALDTCPYPSGIKIPNKDFAAISISRNDFHGEWNYSISPQSSG